MLSYTRKMKKINDFSAFSLQKSNVIRCECGFEILILPDVEAMSTAIYNHAKSHCEQEKNKAHAKIILDYYENYLIEKFFKFISNKKH